MSIDKFFKYDREHLFGEVFRDITEIYHTQGRFPEECYSYRELTSYKYHRSRRSIDYLIPMMSDIENDLILLRDYLAGKEFTIYDLMLGCNFAPVCETIFIHRLTYSNKVERLFWDGRLKKVKSKYERLLSKIENEVIERRNMNIKEKDFDKDLCLKYDFKDTNVVIEYRKIKYNNSKGDSFLVDDMLGILKKDLVLITLFSKGKGDERLKGKGNGVKALKDFVKFCQNIPIVVAVSPIAPNEETFQTLIEDGGLNKLMKVYKKAGFRNVNDLVGYNNSVAMIRCSNTDYNKILKYTK